MANPQAPAQTPATHAPETDAPATDAPTAPEFAPLHEDDYLSEELSKEFNREIWIHKPTGRPYFPNDKWSQAFAGLPRFDHDDPFLQFLRGEIEL